MWPESRCPTRAYEGVSLATVKVRSEAGQALAQELISMGRAAEILGLSRMEIRELAAAWSK